MLLVSSVRSAMQVAVLDKALRLAPWARGSTKQDDTTTEEQEEGTDDEKAKAKAKAEKKITESGVPSWAKTGMMDRMFLSPQ